MSKENSHSNSTQEGLASTCRRPRLALTRDLRRPTEYVMMMDGEYGGWAYNEERAPAMKGRWREEAFRVSAEHPLDLEIGTGNGYHFAHLARVHPGRALVGIELKYKPLIQSIRRAVRAGSTNARIMRYDAHRIDDLFVHGELNDVYIHFPDPWPKQRNWKHRLIQVGFLERLHDLMRPGSFVDFKTDSLDYFEWSVERFKASPFELMRETRDLHQSEWKDDNFVTHFERLFSQQGLKINHVRLIRK